MLPPAPPLKETLLLPYFLENPPAAAIIYFSATAMWCLFKGDAYSRVAFNSVTGTQTCNLVPSTFTCQFPADTMTDREKYMFSSAVSCVQVYLVARHRRAATDRKRRGQWLCNVI